MKIQEHILFSGILFAQQRYWDMVTIDLAREYLLHRHPELRESFVNLAADLPRGTMHVFNNSICGSVMDHMKGKRKQIGHSLASDLVVHRPEQYWQDIIAEEKKTKAA